MKRPIKDVISARLYYLGEDCKIIQGVIEGKNGLLYLSGNLELLEKSLRRLRRLEAKVKEGVEEVRTDYMTGLDLQEE